MFHVRGEKSTRPLVLAQRGHVLSDGGAGRKHAISDSGNQVAYYARALPPDLLTELYPLWFCRDGCCCCCCSGGSWRRLARHRWYRSRRVPFPPDPSWRRSDPARGAPHTWGQALSEHPSGFNAPQRDSQKETVVLQDWISSGNTSGWLSARDEKGPQSIW